MWPPFCLTTSYKRTLAFVTTFRHNSSESARHNFTMWALSCATFSGLQRRPENVAQLRAHVVKLCRTLSEDLCRKFVTNARSCLQEVVRQNGDHIEHVLHQEQFSSLWGLILYQMSNVFVIIKMCYVHNQWYDIPCATLYIYTTMEEILSKIWNKCSALSTVFHTAFVYETLHRRNFSLRTHTAPLPINWQFYYSKTLVQCRVTTVTFELSCFYLGV